METNKKCKGSTNDFYVSEIINNNLSKHNKYLVENGFIKLKKNLKYLLKFDKDQDKDLAALLNKKYEKKDVIVRKLTRNNNSSKE